MAVGANSDNSMFDSKNERIQAGNKLNSLSYRDDVTFSGNNLTLSEITGITYSNEYDGLKLSDGTEISPLRNLSLDLENSRGTAQGLEKRLGWRDCCLIIMTWNSISSGFSPSLHQKITNWIFRSASDM